MQKFYTLLAIVLTSMIFASCTTPRERPDSEEVLQRIRSLMPHHCLIDDGVHCILRPPKDFSNGRNA